MLGTCGTLSWQLVEINLRLIVMWRYCDDDDDFDGATAADDDDDDGDGAADADDVEYGDYLVD